MDAVIADIAPGSVAHSAGLKAGDRVLAVNGNTQLEDLFDYQFEVLSSGYLELHVARTDGTEEIFEIEKEEDEEPGIVFQSPVFTPIKTCNNACPFCFIDQQPEGLRSSLYLKDDDYRLSYFNNTYITLTNLTPHDRERISRIRPGPLYVSVHATTPEVREILLKNKKAGTIMEELSWLKSLNVPFHCQVVICPGINDGEVLTQTLNDLATLRPEAMSVAVVPVGLTQHRDKLTELTPVTSQSAGDVIDRVNAFKASYQKTSLYKDQGDDEEDVGDITDFVFLSDEFYLKSGRSFPNYNEYGDFPQLDDGVGTGRMLLEDFFKQEDRLPERLDVPVKQLILTGRLATMILQPVIFRMNAIENMYLDLVAVESDFWGEAVDVAGVITGHDMRRTLKSLEGQGIAGYDSVMIPSVMLKEDTDLFLDDVSVSDLSKEFGLPFQVIDDPYSATEFITRCLKAPQKQAKTAQK